MKHIPNDVTLEEALRAWRLTAEAMERELVAAGKPRSIALLLAATAVQGAKREAKREARLMREAGVVLQAVPA